MGELRLDEGSHVVLDACQSAPWARDGPGATTTDEARVAVRQRLPYPFELIFELLHPGLSPTYGRRRLC